MAHAPVPPRIRRVQASALVLLVIAGTLNYVDRAALSIANPLIREELGLSISDMGLLLSAFLWASAFCVPLGLRFQPASWRGADRPRWSAPPAGPRLVGLVACPGGGWSGRELLAVRRRPRLPWCWRSADVFRRGAVSCATGGTCETADYPQGSGTAPLRSARPSRRRCLRC